MANRFLSNIKINDAYTFPASDGTNGQVIKTDGSGNLSFAQLAADSASVMYKDTFTGDGSTTGFTLSNALNDEVQSNIYIDGVYQSKSTYSVSGTAITFSTAPLSGHEIEVISTTGINSGPTAIYTDTFTANGSATAFTLGQTVHSENQTIVFLNGVYQFKGTYTLSGTTLTLDTAPSNGVSIEVMSIGSAYSGGDILYDHDFTSAGLMTTNGSGVYSITANNSANWNTAYGWGDHSTQSYATQSYVGTQISNLVDSSPATLNTLNELAAALGDDPNFATTTATSIGLKAPLASPSFTGDATFSGSVTTDKIIIDGASNSNVSQFALTRTDFSWGIFNETNLRFYVQSGNTTTPNGQVLEIATNGNATFSGSVTSTGLNVNAGTYHKVIATFPATYTTNLQIGQQFNVNNDALTDTVTFAHTGTEAASDFIFTVAGNEKLKIQGNGNATFSGQVSVGNYAIPSDHQFQIAHLGQSYARFALTNSQTGNGSSDGLIFQMENLNSIIKNQENGTLGFGTNGRETDILIDSSGQVGIGVTDPQAKLEVKGASAGPADGNEIISVTNTTGNTKLLLGVVENFYGWIQSAEGSTYRNLLLNLLGGSVGIGVENPAEKLEVAGNVGVNGFITHNGDSGTFMGWSANDTNVFYTAGNERMRIDSSGNVTFNGDVTIPSGSLNVGGNATVKNMLTINIDDISTGENRGLKLYNQNSTGQQWNLTTGIVGQENTSFCIRDATNNVNAFTMAKTSGNANFAGTVETTTLRTDVINNKANSANIIYRSGTSTLVGGGTTANKLYVLDNGNVGLGTTNPQDKLHVSGDAIISSTRFGDFATASMNTTGVVVATVAASTNGQSAIVEFVASGNNGGYYNVVYSCYNGGGVWYYNKNIVGTGGNIEVAETNGSGSSTLSFSFRATSGSASYTPRVMMKAMPYNLVTFF